jgi:hypothetical protein
MERKVILIFGKRGSGKSFLLQKLIEKTPRLLTFDTLGEYTQGVVCDNVQTLAGFWQKHYHQNFRLIYRPLKPAEEVETIAGLVWTCGNMTFAVEEIDTFCGPLQIGDNFAQIIQRGRHKNIELIGITQRPFGINRLLTSQAKEIYVFNTNEPRDREYLRNLLGSEIDAKLDALKQYEFIKWTDGQQELITGKA